MDLNKSKTTTKTPFNNGLEMVRDGIITEDQMNMLIRTGKMAGPREKESYRLKGLSGLGPAVTVAFPTISVSVSGNRTQKDIHKQDIAKVNEWKAYLKREITPVYEKARSLFTDKVMVPNK